MSLTQLRFPASRVRTAWLRAGPLFFVALACGFGVQPPDGVKQVFDLPADSAEKSIRRFAEQSGLEVFYPSSATRGVRTMAVTGEMTARDALDAMLAGTGLIVVRDEQSGAFSLRRDAPGGLRPAARDRDVKPPPLPRLVPRRLPTALAPVADSFSPAIVLSPFEVVSENKGYYAANTTSGTRLNAKLEDLGASISVVTKEQMEDFALLDLNNIFSYEANTEGTGNYTDFLYNRNFEPVSATELSPHTANRIRGLGAVNTTWGNFETSGRVPIDPLNVDAVEISRGPNASLFGIGSPAGTVNAVPSSANLTRDKSQLAFRADRFGGHRSSIDLNRVLERDVLAVRGSAVHQHEGFNLKPSGLDTVRLNGMARFKPFNRTTIAGSYSKYRMQGNRPNITPPRETITGWIAAGRPTWDPIARTVKKNGIVVGTYPAGVPPVFTGSPQDVFTNFFIDPNGTSYVSAGRHTTTANPDLAAPGGSFLVNVLDDPIGFRTVQPLYARIPSAVDQALYDWSSINLAAPNRVEDEAAIANVMWDQVILDTPRQVLAAQVGWFREQTDNYASHPVGAPSNVSTVAALHIDVNERRLDGTPNPNFLRPYFGATTPYHISESIDRDTYRGQIAYKLDLRHEKNGLRWLGMHQITGYAEYKEIISREASAYQAIADKHPWLGAGVSHAGRGSTIGGMTARGPNIALGYFRYYLGDNRGANIDYAPGRFAPGGYAMSFGNPTDGFVRENIMMASATYAAGGAYNQRAILKSRGVILQSHLFKDRVVTTFGVRRDERFGRSGGAFQLQSDGVTVDHAVTDRWSTSDWNRGRGPTRTAGMVVKPLPWLSLHANRSDSFQPEPVSQNLYREFIPDPAGEGTDYGFALNLLNGRLFVKVNHYKTLSIDRRGGTAANFANRVRNIDFVYDYSLQKKAESWFHAEAAAQGITLTTEQLHAKMSGLMKLPQEYLQPLRYSINAVEDIVAEGNEIEVHYNPTNTWTVKLNVARQESISKNIGPEINEWIAERTKVWETIIDPSIGRPWFTEPYNSFRGGFSPKDYLDEFVIAPLKLAQALEGKSMPQVRKYRANLSTRFGLTDVTDHEILKRFSVGGALRWEGRGAIGYHGLQPLPGIITAFDPSRPILDQAHLNVDAFVGYRTRLFSDQVTSTWQLNVRNLTEGGRLQPISADPDGQPNAYRIIAPRQFILSVTFDL